MLDFSDPGTWEPFHDVPRFFRREWLGLVIYGYSARSRYPEDHIKEEEVFTRRHGFPSVCFSTVEPNGEWGFTGLHDVVEITEDEFRAARDRGWVG